MERKLLLSLTTATQLLWPILLVSTYFVTCSFYPWMSALAVLFLNLPFSSSALFSLSVKRSAEFIKALGSKMHLSLDGVNVDDETSGEFLYGEYEGESPPEMSASQISYSDLSASAETVPYPSSHPSKATEEIALTPSQHFLPRKSYSVPGEYISPSTEIINVHPIPSLSTGIGQSMSYEVNQLKSLDIGLSRSGEVSQSRFGGKDAVQLNNLEYRHFSPDTEMLKQREIPRRRIGSLPEIVEKDGGKIHDGTKEGKQTRSSKKPYLGMSLDIRKKKGYCGRCGKADYLPFREGFTELRKPYHTRSGLIYGPTHRFLPLTDFVKEYGLH